MKVIVYLFGFVCIAIDSINNSICQRSFFEQGCFYTYNYEITI
jgi:hypothetical protein